MLRYYQCGMELEILLQHRYAKKVSWKYTLSEINHVEYALIGWNRPRNGSMGYILERHKEDLQYNLSGSQYSKTERVIDVLERKRKYINACCFLRKEVRTFKRSRIKKIAPAWLSFCIQ